ncbi:argininosuccinate lyase [Pyrobaculum islandicum DSM 4184]|uniref:Argininosuccinate lyase n=1 Tax=Pyrobaculum islandicum (strain DSM 4184 / JCM 9189 / GEO3) TaxID=384616 RepID=ARLY_PYRIL|nr:argininosuccinate lyase [Pyrobaculum islandicum]A1RR78.1 RecName: Full=Argininosuccinate lyase; Short=ASAL; AltName: Full=Arginosuccinase [Pyrobaculum islandicum DSM 4184]ABL87460.1 argininosuccinate lyase [Pyrobaculum islandicum DSM 4184]
MSFYRSWIGEEGELIKRYTSSIKDDVEIAEEVIKVMEAHVKHLAEVGIMPKEAADAILKTLKEATPEQLLSSEFEDIHEALEKWLIDRLGEETAGWVGLGRSRNDHVAAAIRLAALRKASALRKNVEKMRCILAKKALEYADCAMPSFTHFQPAQAITFGHYLLAVDELAAEFLHVLKAVEKLLKRSPLGAGPAGGTRTPIDRERLAKLAGFEDVVENALYASGSRFFALALASAVVSFLTELSRTVDDLIRWNSPLVGYVAAPDSHVSTSSIMPHKRNLVTLEVFRARAAEALGHLTALNAVVMKIGLGYSLDLQEATRHLWAVLNMATEGVEIFIDFLEKMSFNCVKAREDAERYHSTSSDTAETIALSGVPFRKAYFQLAKEIKEGTARLMSIEEALQRPTRGSANPEEVKKAASTRLVFCREKPL